MDVLLGIECLKKNRVQFNTLTLVNADNVTCGRTVYRYLCDNGSFFQQYIPCVDFDGSGKPSPYSITGNQWGEFLCEIFDADCFYDFSPLNSSSVYCTVSEQLVDEAGVLCCDVPSGDVPSHFIY